MKKCKYEKALRKLVSDNQRFIRWLDLEMAKPSTVLRGRRIAQAMNALNMAVDHVRYFTLGVDYRRDRRRLVRKRVVAKGERPTVAASDQAVSR